MSPSPSETAFGGETPPLQWDAEGRMTQVVQNGSPYLNTRYNALGWAVEWYWPPYGVTADGVRDPAGQGLASYNQTFSGWGDQEVRLGGRVLAQYKGSDTFFLHPNALGSDTQISDEAGAERNAFVYYPWQNWTYVGMLGWDTYFAGFDQGTGPNYNATFRVYSGSLGRWLSPDPLGGDVTNPQSLNRYAYVLNNPTNLVDPLGLCQFQGHYYPPPCLAGISGVNGFGGYVAGQAATIRGFGNVDEFDLVFPTGCNSEGCGSVLDPNGAAVLSVILQAQINNTPTIQAAPPPPPPDNRPSCASVFVDALTGGEASPTPEVVEQGAKAGAGAAAAEALNVQLERGLVVPLRSSTVRFFVNVSELFGDLAEVFPVVFVIPDVVRADFATAKANFNRTCKPAFP